VFADAICRMMNRPIAGMIASENAYEGDSANARYTHPQKKPLYLPIAEFDLDLLQKPYPPFPPEEIVEQQKALDFDNGWARPIVLQNLRLAA